MVSENRFNKMLWERRVTIRGCLADGVKFQEASINQSLVMFEIKRREFMLAWSRMKGKIVKRPGGT